jgi:uncharacterized RDD family membrane protein YckC
VERPAAELRETAPIDTTIDIVTPENIAFHYRAAGPFQRLPAYFIDLVIRVFLFGALGWALGVASRLLSPVFGSLPGSFSLPLLLLAYFVLEWFYGGLFETYMNGQTPGKRIVGIRVLAVSGEPINGLQAVLRNVLRIVDLSPLLSLEVFGLAPVYIIPTGLIGLAAAALNRRFQRLGDLASGVMVVVEERRWLTGLAQVEDPRAAQLAAYVPANFRASRSMARSLAAYMDRRRFFTPARRREVAQHLARPLLQRFELPEDTSYDLLLCAVYYRTFIADRGDDERAAAGVASPLAPPAGRNHERSGA